MYEYTKEKFFLKEFFFSSRMTSEAIDLFKLFSHLIMIKTRLKY